MSLTDKQKSELAGPRSKKRFLIPLNLQLFGDDGGAGGAGGEGGTGGAGGQGGGGGQRDAASYEAEIAKLRKEAGDYRVKAKGLEEAAGSVKTETTAAILKALGLEADPNKNFEGQLADLNGKLKSANERAAGTLIKAEVKFKAAELGIVDPDAALALMDRAKVKVNDDDTVEGVKEALEALLVAKPYLKGQTQQGGGTLGAGTNPPGGGGNGGKVWTRAEVAKLNPADMDKHWPEISAQMAAGTLK